MLKALGSIPSTAEKTVYSCVLYSSLQRSLLLSLCLSSRRPGSKHKGVSVCDENIHTPSHSSFHFYKTRNHMGTWSIHHVHYAADHSHLSVALCLCHLLPSVHQWTSGCSCTWALPYMLGTPCAIAACMGTRASIDKYPKPSCCSGVASEKLPSALWWPLRRLLASAWPLQLEAAQFMCYLPLLCPHRYLEEVGYTDTILDMRSKRVRSLLGRSLELNGAGEPVEGAPRASPGPGGLSGGESLLVKQIEEQIKR